MGLDLFYTDCNGKDTLRLLSRILHNLVGLDLEVTKVGYGIDEYFRELVKMSQHAISIFLCGSVIVLHLFYVE
jgi:hypothetical protein